MAWINVAADDAQVSRATGGHLAKSDLDALCNPVGWMTDALINFGVVGLSGVTDDVQNRVLWLKPALVASAKDSAAAGAFAESLGGRGALGPPILLDKVERLPRDANVILFPVNQGNKHWSLLAFHANGRSFVHYDSLQQVSVGRAGGAGNDEAARQLIRKLVEEKYLSVELNFRNAPVKRQEDSYRCGLFVIQFARLYMRLGKAPDDELVSAIDSLRCDEIRDTMLLFLGPLVQEELPMAQPHDVPLNEQFRAEKREQLQKAIAKVQQRLDKEEAISMQVTGQKPCPMAPAGSVTVTLRSSSPKLQDFESARVAFAAGKEQFDRAAKRQGDAWVTQAPFQAGGGFNVDLNVTIQPEPEFQGAAVTRKVEVKAGESADVTVTFAPKPERRLHARFLVADKETPRPFPQGFRVEFVFDDGEKKIGATVQADGTCVSDDGNKGVRIPWRHRRVTARFPAANAWRRVTWDPRSDPGSATSFEEVDEELLWGRGGDVDRGAPGLLPKHAWELAPADWELPPRHLRPNLEYGRQIDLTQDGALGSAAQPLRYVLKAAATPSRYRRMNDKIIEHVVVLMLENRGFDHFLGYLYEGKTQPSNNYPREPKGKHAKLGRFVGMEGLNPANPYDFSHDGKKAKGVLHPRRGARAANVPRINPHEDFIHVFQDMYYQDSSGKILVADPKWMENKFGKDNNGREALCQHPDGTYKVPGMNGWAQNYCDGILHHAGKSTELTEERVSEIMDMYLPEQLPVLSGLARHYAVSDLWFCSVPSQTNTNRAFWLTGAAAGLVKNDFYPTTKNKVYQKARFDPLACDRLPAGPPDDPLLHRRSLFDVLEENAVSWKYYWTCAWPPIIGNNWLRDLLPQFEPGEYDANLPLIKQLYDDAKSGTLPAVSYIEPLWGGGKVWKTRSPANRFVGNEFHPVQDVTCGEFFLKEVYEALFGDDAPKRDSTVLVITFDENGGTYDHLPPWPASPPGREPSEDEGGVQFGFKFDCFGIRVPTLLISKYVAPGTVFRSPTAVPFDHTSIISTILKWQGIPPEKWKLGNRVANAPTFDGVLEDTGETHEAKSKALKFKALPFGGNDQEVKVGKPLLIEVVGGKADGYTLAMPEASGFNTVYLYDRDKLNPSRWLFWLVNDRVDDQPLHPDDEVFIFSERYLPDRLTLYYDPYQRLTLDPYKRTEKRWARFRAGEWDIWKIEKAGPTSQEVTPILKSDRIRAILEGPGKKAAPVRFDLKLEFEDPAAPKELQYTLSRTRAEVEVFQDEKCAKAFTFDGNVAKLDSIAADLATGATVPAWARPGDKQGFSLTLSAFKARPDAAAKGKAGAPSTLELKRAFEFLEGPSRWLQLIDSFESVGEIKASIDRIRTLAALADMRADELANFAIKRLFIRKGVLDQPVVIKIDGKPAALKHPLSEGKLPLRYSDFVVDRSGPKFLGALDADVAVEALMYKDACISTKLAELKALPASKGGPKAQSFDPNLIQSVRDMAERRLARLHREKPASYPEVTESEIEAATSVFELKHMAQRKLSDFDLTARETETLSKAIAAELLQSCGQLPPLLVLEIGKIAWSRGGPIDSAKVNGAKLAGGNDGARAAAAYAARCTGPEYTPKKEYRHGKYKGTGYYHMLIDEVGAIACKLLEDSLPDVDAGYGLGIPYMGPQVEERNGRFEREKNKDPKEQDRFEIGDIITDETSHYGTVFSHNVNIQEALARLKTAGVAWSYDSFDKGKNLRENCRALLARSGKADIAR